MNENYEELKKEIEMMKENMNNRFQDAKEELNSHSEKLSQHDIDIAELNKHLKKIND